MKHHSRVPIPFGVYKLPPEGTVCHSMVSTRKRCSCNIYTFTSMNDINTAQSCYRPRDLLQTSIYDRMSMWTRYYRGIFFASSICKFYYEVYLIDWIIEQIVLWNMQKKIYAPLDLCSLELKSIFSLHPVWFLLRKFSIFSEYHL